MKTKRPFDAKNTSRMLRAILPPDFKIVKDKSSNGYKFLNLLYGIEVDFARDNLEEAYDNSFIDTFDLSSESVLYEARLSGIANQTHLDSDQGPIKITSKSEFYDGDPTRMQILSSIPLDTGIIPTGVVGLNYFRKDERGSGYLLINLDRSQEESYISSIYPSYRVELSNTFSSDSDILRYSGYYTGIATQKYSEGTTDEVLVPLDSKTLSGNYPLTRRVLDDSGVFRYIDHYEPYLGWIRDENGSVTALVDYSGTYYYDSNGDKIYYRTALNNPYGYNNYDTAYLDLRFVPISGTLKMYDIDILNSGSAIEIPKTGKTLYYLKSDRMNVDDSGVFDPVYLGYDQKVPSDRGFSDYMVGKLTTPLKTTSWDYLHDGGVLNPETLIYQDGSGAITNRIKINNPHSRYIVEYKYKLHDYSRYITSLDTNGYVNNNALDPVYTLDNVSGNLLEREYEFTKDPSFIEKDDNDRVIAYKNAKILTLNGLDVRPGKRLFRIDFDIPMMVSAGSLENNISVHTNKTNIGYSNNYVPEVTTQRNYYINCPFDQKIILNTVSESDLTGNHNFLVFENTGSSNIYRINYGTYYGKKIIHGTGDSYYQAYSIKLLKDYTHVAFGCRLRFKQEYKLLEIHDNYRGKYLELTIKPDGLMTLRMNGYKFNSVVRLSFDESSKEFIVRYKPDDVSSSVPYIELFYRNTNDISFREARLFRAEDTSDTVTSSFFRCFKNCTIDIDYLKVYNEVF